MIETIPVLYCDAHHAGLPPCSRFYAVKRVTGERVPSGGYVAGEARRTGGWQERGLFLWDLCPSCTKLYDEKEILKKVTTLMNNENNIDIEPTLKSAQFTPEHLDNGLFTPELDTALETKIQDILDTFDFDKVHDAMSKLGYTWNDETPTAERIKEAARIIFDGAKVFLHVYGTEEVSINTGGLVVSISFDFDDYNDKLKAHDVKASLAFVIEKGEA